MSSPNANHPSVAASPVFADLTEATSPAAARPLLAAARDIFGFVPNLAVVMATEPATLESYFHSLKAFGETSLNPVEQQVVLMAVSRANSADYSLAVHAALAEKLGATAETIKGVGTGGALHDPKLAALRRFAELLTFGRGQVRPTDIEEFLAAGYDRRAVVAVAFGVAVKTFANAVAHLAQTPVDGPFAPALANLRR